MDMESRIQDVLGMDAFLQDVADLLAAYPVADTDVVQSAQGALAIGPYTVVTVVNDGVCIPLYTQPPVDDRTFATIEEMLFEHSERARSLLEYGEY